MRFHAKYVSVGEFGDEYVEVSFDSEDPGNDDLDLSGDENPYLIVQRQLEDGDGGVCYIETHDHDTYSGHFRLRLTVHAHALRLRDRQEARRGDLRLGREAVLFGAT